MAAGLFVLARECTTKFGLPCAGDWRDPDLVAWIWIVAFIAITAIAMRYWLRRRRDGSNR